MKPTQTITLQEFEKTLQIRSLYDTLAANAAEPKPNIVLILIDDMG